MSDHIAGMSLFPDALTIAHRHYRHTFLSQNRLVDEFYREPQVVFDSAMTIRWGQHELPFLHNPAKTMDHVSVAVPTAELVCADDNIDRNRHASGKSGSVRVDLGVRRTIKTKTTH